MADITVSAGVLAGTYTGGEASLDMRILLTETFTASDDVTLLKSVLEQGDFYQSVFCSVSVGVVSYPEFVIKSTTDAIADPDRAKYVFALYTETGQFVQNVAKRIRVPVTPNPTTIGLLTQFSQLLVEESEPGGPGDVYTKAEVDLMLATDIATAVAALIGGAPGALDTLNELAAALGDDENFAAIVTAALVPVGGTTGQILAKSSNVNHALTWLTVGSLPPGGALGDRLVKQSFDDFDADWETPGMFVTSLEGLLDVDLTGIADEDILQYDLVTNTWYPVTLPGGALAELTDVDIVPLADGDVLIWNSATNKWEAQEPTGGGGGATEQTVVVTTGSLAVDATATGVITLGRRSTIKKTTSTKYLRVRLYKTAALRTADAARGFTDTSYVGTPHGIILDLLVTSGGEPVSWLLSPDALSSNGDDPAVDDIYYSITNRSAGATAITVGFVIEG